MERHDLKFDEEAYPLHAAAFYGEMNVAYDLIVLGLDVNGVDSFGFTALHRAVVNGHLDIVRLLIENGAKVNLTRIGDSRNAWAPLHMAAEHDRPECAQILLAAGAEPDIEDQHGQTPLMLAVDEMISPGTARILVEFGADGRRAWDWASYYVDAPGGAEVVKLLKLAGADQPRE